MGDINIKYEHLEKTDAIHEYINTRFSRLDKFLHDDYHAAINIIDNTPKKKINNIEYKLIIDLNNIEKGKNVKYNITHKCKDLYSGIDKMIDTVQEKLRRNHEKNTNYFKRFKQGVMDNYSKIMNDVK